MAKDELTINSPEVTSRIRGLTLEFEGLAPHQIKDLQSMVAAGELAELGALWVQVRDPEKPTSEWQLTHVADKFRKATTQRATKNARNLYSAKDAVFGFGSYKTAKARIAIKPGEGLVRVNGRLPDEYFTNRIALKAIFRPLELAGLDRKFDIRIRTNGGGTSGQSRAISLAIARALVIYDSETRKSLLKEKLLTRSSRMKERKKYGRKGARKGFQFSKR